jgi:hypothetical protein
VPVLRLPQVSAPVRRRRRVFLASVGSLVVLTAAVPFATHSTSPAAAAAAGGGAAQPDPGPTTPTAGCTLSIGATSLVLTLDQARRLTDIAGTDQNAARSLAATSAAVAKAWPEQAAAAPQIAYSLRGYRPAALGCTGSLEAATRQPMESDGLTARANTMWKAIQKVFGWLPAGGFAPGGVTTGHVPGSAHYEGRAIDFFYRPITAKTIRHGWVLSQWLIAHAQELKIATVIFDAKAWTPGGWAQRGWTVYTYPDGTTTDPTLLHYDHVHVDVERGS